jgi:hypothetical protein
MLFKEIFSKNSFSTTALTFLFLSGATIPSHAMDLCEEMSLSTEMEVHIIKSVAKTFKGVPIPYGNGAPALRKKAPSELWSLRGVSHHWKDCVDYVIKKKRFLSLPVYPWDLEAPLLPSIAPLASGVILAAWSFQDNSSDLQKILSYFDPKTVIKISYVEAYEAFLSSIAVSNDPTEYFKKRDQAFAQGLQVEAFEVFPPSIFNDPTEYFKKGAQAFAQGLQKFPELSHVHINHLLHEEGGIALGEAMKKLPKLESIFLSGATGPKGMEGFAEGLKSTPLITYLDIGGGTIENNMGDRGCIALGNALENLPCLKWLHVTDYPIPALPDPEAAISCSGMLHLKSKIETHQIKYQEIGTDEKSYPILRSKIIWEIPAPSLYQGD